MTGTGQDEQSVKQIFVLNVNATSTSLSIQESKAMTPCFLHTPNMTNKWNDFKPPAIDEEPAEEPPKKP